MQQDPKFLKLIDWRYNSVATARDLSSDPQKGPENGGGDQMLGQTKT